MPWRETSPMDQRRLFINDHRHSVFPFTELCARYGISRKTGYKWIARFEGGGYPALADLTRRPRSCAHQTPSATEEAILTVRRRHPFWGAKKLLKLCRRRNPERDLAGPQHDLQYPQEEWLDPGSSASPSAWASWPPHEADGRSERDLDRRLQGRVQKSRRTVLLSSDDRRRLQQVFVRLPGTAQPLPQGHPASFHQALQDIRLAEGHPNGQRLTLRQHRPR